MSASLESRLIEVASAFLQVDKSTLSLDSGPGDSARWDSFAHVGLIGAVESAFDVTFDVDDVAGFVTLRDMFEALEARNAK